MKCAAFILISLIFVGLLASQTLASTMADAIPTSGLVSYWPADGNTNDIVGPNNGSFVAPSGFASGYVGQAFSMNGGYVSVPDSPSISLTGPFTLTAMIRINRNDIQQGIMEKYDQPGVNGYILRLSGGKLAAYICDPTLFGANHGIIGATTVSTGIWHSVAAVYDGSTLKVYLDGILDGTVATTTTPTDGAASLKIGARGDDANVRLDGLMDEVRIYNRALSSSEIPRGDGPPATIHNIADGDVAGLNAAIIASNANADLDVINLAPGGHYTLTSAAGPDGFHGDSGLPIVQGPSQQVHGLLTINGNGATIERSTAPGTPQFRILNALFTDLTLDGVVIKGGYGQGSRCGGGGLYLNVSNTIIRNSTITDNFGLEGGGICNNNTSTLKIENSTISYNTGYGGRTGGGILDFSAAQLWISNSTLYENRADGGAGFEGRGDNIADAFSPIGSVVLKNSIVGSPTRGAGVDCEFFKADSRGHNIFSDSSCVQTVSGGDLIVPNLTLGLLANNGGPTPTHALLSGSPAIDAIPLADCTTIAGVAVSQDQRGLPRPFGSGCDIGAYESQVPTQVATTTSLTSNSPTTFGMDMVFTATVTSADAAPTGSVEFYQDSIPIGSSQLVNGVAVLTRPSFNASTIGITAEYVGQGQFLASGATTTHVIQKATPTVTVTGGIFPYDGNAHPASAVATGVHGEPVTINEMNIIYNPGGVTPPSNVGMYAVTANFISGDSNYGNASGSGTVKITDSTPPMIQPTVVGTPGNNGWYTGNVDISWEVTDPESPTSDSAGCAAAHVTTDTNGVTFTCSSTSDGGTATRSVTIKRDATGPGISCGSADGAWHAADISIACSANDGISGLSAPGDAGFSLSTSVPAGTETANAPTNSRPVCDVAGNCSTAGPVGGNKIDKKAPVITITAPTSGPYLLDQAVTVNYNCSDGGSGVASCSGTSANGGQLNTATTGNLAFTVNAADNAGNAASPVTVNYAINFGIAILFDQTKASKSGSTVPVKIRLVDANGINVSSASNVVHAVSVIQTSSQATTTLDDSGNSNPDFDFRYDAALGGYIFNLKTTGYGTGSYLLNFVVGNAPTVYSVGFQVRQ